MIKAYKCPDCGGKVEPSHDDIWECEDCYNEFIGAPCWLDYWEEGVMEINVPKYRYKTLKELVTEFGDQVELEILDSRTWIKVGEYRSGINFLGALTDKPGAEDYAGKIFIREEEKVTKYVYIVQRKDDGHVHAVLTNMSDAMMFKEDAENGMEELTITPKHLISDYIADQKIEQGEF